MSKRPRYSARSSTDSEETSVSPHDPLELRRFCLTLIEGKGGAPISVPQLAKYDGAPVERTLYRWLHDEKFLSELPDPPPRRGTEPALTDELLDVVGGYVLFCAEQHQICGWHKVADFIADVFRVYIQQPWVSKHLSELGFSSSLTKAFGTPRTIKAAVEFLEANQKKFARRENKARIVAIDQISFWDCGIVETTYSLRGGYLFSRHSLHLSLTKTTRGQSRISDVEPGSKYIVDTAFCADGTCFPQSNRSRGG